MTSISDQLKEAIEAHGTLYRVAKDSGVSYPVVARFLSGERDVRLATAARLAEALGLQLAPKADKPSGRRQTKPKR